MLELHGKRVRVKRGDKITILWYDITVDSTGSVHDRKDGPYGFITQERFWGIGEKDKMQYLETYNTVDSETGEPYGFTYIPLGCIKSIKKEK